MTEGGLPGGVVDLDHPFTMDGDLIAILCAPRLDREIGGLSRPPLG